MSLPSEPSRSAPLVLHIDSESGFSGGEVQVFLLIVGLAERGWRNALVCRAGSAVDAEARSRGIATYSAPMRSDLDLASIATLYGAILASGAHLVHLHTGRATWLGAIAARLARVPAISTRRMDRAVARGWRTRMVYDRLLRRVVAISPAVAGLLRDGGVSPSRIMVIASAVDPSRLRPYRSPAAMRGELGAPIETPVLLVLASLVERKGVDVLLRALHVLAAGGHRPVAWIAGDGPERAGLEILAGDLGVTGQVRFLGRRADAADLLGACDVVVVPSRREGLGVAALEAMAAGRPVVASAVGGLADAVVHERTGLLVPPDDPAALARALEALLGDAGARRRLGEGARRVAEAFSAEQMVEAYAALYRAVLQG